MVTIKGGSALEARLQELAAKVSRPANLSVGFLEGSTYPDGTPVAMVAAANEFGRPSAGQVSRPFFRNMIADKSPTWGDAVADLLQANGYDANRTMQQMGAGIKGQLTQSISDFTSPPLKPSTIARKGFEKPLIDSNVMFEAVSFTVE